MSVFSQHCPIMPHPDESRTSRALNPSGRVLGSVDLGHVASKLGVTIKRGAV